MSKKYFLLGLLLLASPVANAADIQSGHTLAEKQIFTYRILDEFTTVDPQVVEDTTGSDIVRDLFEGLYNQDAEGNLVPGVALSHEASDDFLTYTFHLRTNAKWSDGQPVTASDFVYAWRRAVDPELASPYAWYMELMSIENAVEIIKGEKPVTDLGVSATDAQTLVVKLTKPLTYFPKMVTHATTFPSPSWTIDQHGKNWTRPENIVSNGAYVLKEHILKERSKRVRNPRYWDNDKTVLEEVIALVINEENQALTRYRAGELDGTDIPAGQYPTLKEELPDEVYVFPRLCNYYFTFNLSPTGLPAFQDVRVRQALSYALDRNIITEKVLQAGQFPAYHFVPKATADYEAPVIAYEGWTQAERDQKAKELLERAGYGKNGKKLSFTYLYNTSESHKQIAIVMSQLWKQKLGVEVKLENQEWKVFLENRGAQKFEMARGAWCGDYNEASTFLDLLTTESGYNDGKFSSTRVDQLMGEAKTTSNTNELYKGVEQILSKQMPIIPVYHYTRNLLLKPHVENWPTQNIEQNWYSKDLYISTE